MVQQFYVQNTKSKASPQAGQAFLITVLLVMFSMLTLTSIVAVAAFRGARISELELKSKRSYFLSESGIEDAVYRAKLGKFLPASYSLSLYGANTTITVTTIAGGKEIESSSDIGNIHRTIKTSLKQGTGASFSYAVQVGNGGVSLENSSRIIGSIYSNGNISGKNSSEITQDAFAAENSTIIGTNSFSIGGIARAHMIDGVTVGKSASSTTSISDSSIGQNAYADSISSSSITNDAYYFSSISGSSVGGTLFPATPPPADVPSVGFPISDDQINAFEAYAQSGGVHSSPCPYIISSGTVDLGPIKIDCDFTITGTAVVNMRGTIWVRGNFTMSSTAKLKLDPSFGLNSEVVVVDNPLNRTTSSKISLENSVQILGSAPGSYIAIISQNNSAELGGSEVAIRPKNSVDASIYYAKHGLINIENSASLKEVTAYKLSIKNSATVSYESGLASVQFAGPTGGLDVTGWLEVP